MEPLRRGATSAGICPYATERLRTRWRKTVELDQSSCQSSDVLWHWIAPAELFTCRASSHETLLFLLRKLYYFDAAAGSAPSRIGDYQGVQDINDDSLTPAQISSSLFDELRKSIPARLTWEPMVTTTSLNSTTSPRARPLAKLLRLPRTSLRDHARICRRFALCCLSC